MFIENLVLVSEESKRKYIHDNFDERLNQLLQISKQDNKEEWFIEAKRVLEILQQDTNAENALQDTPVMEDEKDVAKRRITTAPLIRMSTGAIPVDIYQLLIRGCDVKTFSDDGTSRWMNIFVPTDLSDIRCKRLKENFIKPKWMMKLGHIRAIESGYDKNSPIYHSSEFYFRKLPKKELCFSVLGEHRADGVKNFHVLCDNSLMARRLFEGFSFLLSMYRRTLLENLKRENE